MQTRDITSQFVERAESWNVTDGDTRSLIMSRAVQCIDVPWDHSAFERRTMERSFLSAAVREVYNAFVGRSTRIASVVHEVYLPLEQPVAVAGTLDCVKQSSLYVPYTSGDIRARLLSRDLPFLPSLAFENPDFCFWVRRFRDPACRRLMCRQMES
jgi:hypothetical protein